MTTRRMLDRSVARGLGTILGTLDYIVFQSTLNHCRYHNGYCADGH